MSEPFLNLVFPDASLDPRYDPNNARQKAVHDKILSLFDPDWNTNKTASAKNLALASVFAVVAQSQSDFGAYAAALRGQASKQAAQAQLALAQDAFEAAFAATDVYVYQTDKSQAVDGLYPAGYRRLEANELVPFGIKDGVKLVDDATGLYSALYAKGDPLKMGTKYILASRGTDGPSDYWVSIKQNWGLTASQYEQAAAAAVAVTAAVQKTSGRLILAGHSLGGGLATLQALVTKHKAYVFQTAGVSFDTLSAHGVASVDPKSLVTAFDYHGDWLDNLQIGQGGFLLRPPLGRSVVLPRIALPPGAANDNSTDWHLMNFVAPAMLQLLKAGNWPQ